MSKPKNYVISVEVLKYPYSGKSIESEEFISEKICCSSIRVRKKVFKKARWLVVYGDFILRLTNGAVPSQAIGLPILLETPPIMRHIHSNAGLSKKAIIAQVIQDMPAKIVFNKTEMNQFSIPNQKRTEVKKRIIELFDELKNHKLIDTQFRIIQKNGLSTTLKQLTPLLLTKSKNILFHEIIH
jgi:hypothetical protein